MKVKVLKKFIDKHTKVLHTKGKEIEITKERYEEINSTSFGILVEEIKNTDFNVLTKAELVKYCKENNIDINEKAKKEDILRTIKGEL